MPRTTRSSIWNWITGPALLVALWPTTARPAEIAPPQPPPGFHAAALPPDDVYARALLYNALHYVQPESHTIDARSGYPTEGWNEEPQNKLFLRSFTQLTAIGQWLELLGNVVAGRVETPWLGKDQALAKLAQTAASLRDDQQDPAISDKGLLGNFFDLSTARRMLPLASAVDQRQLVEVFGAARAAALWQALIKRGWIDPRASGGGADIRRSGDYGLAHFDGPLSPYADPPTKNKIMAILDRRGPLIAFGDNANLSMSVAKTIGALLSAAGADPPATAVRRKLEDFLAAQQPGYEFLYDKQTGLFYFGWDTGLDRYFGWEDLHGQWHVGHMDYLVNEFRGPTTFIMLHYGLPTAALANLGFHIKPYRLADSQTRYVLAPWEGSAFQGMGFSLTKAELECPSWHRLLQAFVDVEVDYSRRHGLPGFLSESYTGIDAVYSGRVGIPDIAVDPLPRITDAPSLYTLGVAYQLDHRQMEQFFADRWPLIAGLLTPHGPWEGYNVTQKQPIRVQTSAHTFALILGLLGTGPENIRRYAQAHGSRQRFDDCYRPGQPADLLNGPTQIYAWADNPQAISSQRRRDGFSVVTLEVKRLGIAFVSQADSLDLSGGLLTLGYRVDRPIDSLAITFKPAGQPADSQLITKEILTNLAATNHAEHEIAVVLPATPGLRQIKEVVLTSQWPETSGPIKLTITRFSSAPVQPEKVLAPQ